ncbi:MAG TPA: nucleotidyl transferase AbiEii/AbiGii toxin family protein [Clostridiales bacterium]|mgnify:CR=1 FL=1|nr:nucleotidyl transferase AbiEii/AbiGii toxin family protein [Clostridiales bacterium]
MKFSNSKQFKDWIKNKEKAEGIPANTLPNYYMMERFLERISVSPYNSNFIFKGGFLISSILGVSLRSTLDIDATLKGIAMSEEKIIKVIEEIISIDLGDDTSWKTVGIKNIHTSGKYEDFRITLQVDFFNITEFIKIDLTTGDLLVPKEIEHSYRLMFEDRTISIKAYHLYTILAEKAETVLSRNIANTRAKDFYDLYTLTRINREEIDLAEFSKALEEKCKERGTLSYLQAKGDYLEMIRESSELKELWVSYQNKNKYAQDIDWEEVIKNIKYLVGE